MVKFAIIFHVYESHFMYIMNEIYIGGIWT